ncbi:MAG TPA: alpha/beta hydrolase [Gemmatimonadaceae bacterium]|nr:alpha/beta hydrolase [Gemmatimonadaceae bacterium]
MLALATWPGALSAQSDSAAPPPPGKLIDIGGYKLHLNCTGSGSPTVVLSAGAGDFSTDWALVQPRVAALTRVCSYDRSGAAWSDAGPKPRTVDQEVFDLERLLRAAGEHGPYIMVGQSLGGMVARLFAQKYPRATAGVVLVDAYSEDAQLGLNGKLVRMRLLAKDRPIPAPRSAISPDDAMTADELAKTQDFIKQFIGKPTINQPFDKLPPAAQRARLWAMVQPKAFAQGDDYLAEISARAYAEAQQNPHPLGDIPLIVLARSRSDYPPEVASILIPEHTAQQAKLATLSSNGSEIIVPNSGHHIQLDAPDAVVDAIRTLVGRARRQR